MNDASVLLRTHDLSLSYGRVPAVDRLNITVRDGEIYGFLGRNGAGKTSTIRMRMGMIRPDAGRIELLDFRGRRIELLDFRGRRIGEKQKRRAEAHVDLGEESWTVARYSHVPGSPRRSDGSSPANRPGVKTATSTSCRSRSGAYEVEGSANEKMLRYEQRLWSTNYPHKPAWLT